MGKYFRATAKTCKVPGVPRAKARMMIVLEYVAKFTELARFTDDYVATWCPRGGNLRMV